MMKVGIVIPNAGSKASPKNIETVARWAESMGFHSVWVTDHVTLPERVDSYYPYRSHGRWDYSSDTNWIDPLLSLQWAAAVAPSVKVGTSILVVPLRNPLLLAKQISSLDFLTGGRVILGAGAGWMEEEFKLIGQPYGGRGKRLLEMMDLMRRCWSGEVVDFHGDFYHVSGFRMYPTPIAKNIPVIWGGHSDAALRRCARTGDGWHPTQITLEQLADGIARLQAFCAEAGRNPREIDIVARPGNTYTVDPQSHARHLELGVTHLVADTPIHQADPDLSIMRQEMERIAGVCGVTPRA
ncbi:LLM class F420-dependent oxidoreductase [soil metagenome]|nr:LLM class F420-dependent oxidoreductase [Acidobacteriota bacterium]